MTSFPPIEPILRRLVELANHKKASDIQIYKTRDTSITDFIVIMSVQNFIHIRSLRNEIEGFFRTIHEEGVYSEIAEHPRLSGDPESGWIILDASVMMVHIVSQVLRQDYDLDALFQERADIFYLS